MGIIRTSEIRRLEQRLGREFRFAAQTALNDAAFEIRQSLGVGADRSFAGGATTFTRRGFTVSKKASKSDLVAIVEAKPIQAQYLQLPVFGGIRRPGDYATARSGVVIPGKAGRRSRTGSLPRGYLKRELAKPDVFGGTINLNGSSVRGVFKRPKRKGRTQLEPLKVLAIFRSRGVQYSKSVFDVVGIAQSDFTPNVIRSMNRAIKEIAQFGRVRTAKQRRADG